MLVACKCLTDYKLPKSIKYILAVFVSSLSNPFMHRRYFRYFDKSRKLAVKKHNKQHYRKWSFNIELRTSEFRFVCSPIYSWCCPFDALVLICTGDGCICIVETKPHYQQTHFESLTIIKLSDFGKCSQLDHHPRPAAIYMKVYSFSHFVSHFQTLLHPKGWYCWPALFCFIISFSCLWKTASWCGIVK